MPTYAITSEIKHITYSITKTPKVKTETQI